jgi:tetratricopeptide (TPR) repeat protein
MLMALWSGPITPAQWRGQIFRAGHEWRGRTYEYPHFDSGRLGATDLVRWHHTRTSPRGRRDLDIALAWAADEPQDWRPLNAAAEEAFILGQFELAADCCAKALELDPPVGTRAYFLGLQARARLEAKDPAGARRLARQALKVIDEIDPADADFLGVRTKAWTCLMRCEMALRDREISRCAKRALETATTEEGRRAVIDLVAKHTRKPPARETPPNVPLGGSRTMTGPIRWVAR